MEQAQRTHLLERLSMLLVEPADLRLLAEPELPADTADAMLMAMTADARLAALGYRLDERSLQALEQRYAAGQFCDPAAIVDELHPVPDAEPLYPDFPTQIMTMDEATYRLDQAMHYLSTYGVEAIAHHLGIEVEVRHGIQPDVPRTEKTERDEALLQAKVLSLAFSPEEAAGHVWEQLVYRNERMTVADVALVTALPIPDDADGARIPFHENKDILLAHTLAQAKRYTVQEFVDRARLVAQHPGDVIKFVARSKELLAGATAPNRDADDATTARRMARMPTSARRRLVALLESYPAWSLAENLTLSRERSLRVLEHLSYNRFSRSAEHRAVVDALRDGTLRSWASKKEAAYATEDPSQILAVLGERPGVMVREVVRLLRAGVPEAPIEAALTSAESLSPATLLTTIAKLSVPYEPFLMRQDSDITLHARTAEERRARMALFSWIARKNDWGAKAAAAYPAPPHMATRLPVSGRAYDRAILRLAGTCRVFGLRSVSFSGYFKSMFPWWFGNLYQHPTEEAVRPPWATDALVWSVERKVTERVRTKAGKRGQKDTPTALQQLGALLDVTRSDDEIAYAYHAGLANGTAQEQELRDSATRILRHALYQQLCKCETPLRNKRVYVDEGDYDLASSVVLTNATRDSSSYVVPGMAMRIPAEAHRVRFFVFWNDDDRRVDLDLHATTDRNTHVGWNGSFNESGITMSGDVTTSENAVEYVDVDLDLARKAGERLVRLKVTHFNGDMLSEVATAFTGMLVVDDVAPDHELYVSENVLMRNDLSSVARKELDVGIVSIDQRCLVPTMGPFNPLACRYKATDFLAELLASQQATRVERREDADLVLTVGKAAHDELSLLDNGWFVLS